MYQGYYLNQEGHYRDKCYLAEDNPESIWRFVFQHRDAPRVLVKDAGDNIVIEMLDGVIAWPALNDLQRRELYQRFLGLSAAAVQCEQ